MRKPPYTPAEAYWRFNCATAVNDFFRGLRWMLDGNFDTVDHCFWIADMTPVLYNLEGLDSEQLAVLRANDPTDEAYEEDYAFS